MAKNKRAKVAHRNIIHRHARLRTGAGVHKTTRVKPSEAVTEDDWAAADYARYGTPENIGEENYMEISLKEFREEHSINNGTDMQDALQEWSTDSVVPALCKMGCEVEPDGQCEHGCPSILIRLGMI